MGTIQLMKSSLILDTLPNKCQNL